MRTKCCDVFTMVYSNVCHIFNLRIFKYSALNLQGGLACGLQGPGFEVFEVLLYTQGAHGCGKYCLGWMYQYNVITVQTHPWRLFVVFSQYMYSDIKFMFMFN